MMQCALSQFVDEQNNCLLFVKSVQCRSHFSSKNINTQWHFLLLCLCCASLNKLWVLLVGWNETFVDINWGFKNCDVHFFLITDKKKGNNVKMNSLNRYLIWIGICPTWESWGDLVVYSMLEVDCPVVHPLNVLVHASFRRGGQRESSQPFSFSLLVFTSPQGTQSFIDLSLPLFTPPRTLLLVFLLILLPLTEACKDLYWGGVVEPKGQLTVTEASNACWLLLGKPDLSLKYLSNLQEVKSLSHTCLITFYLCCSSRWNVSLISLIHCFDGQPIFFYNLCCSF